MFDSPKAAHFAAFDLSGRRLHDYRDQRGLDARWLAARAAERRGVDFTRRIVLADLVAIMEACAEASEVTGLRVKLEETELQRIKQRIEAGAWMPATVR